MKQSGTTDNPCPCGRNRTFESCCDRFLSGRKIAKTPEQLMRSRYTAYALGGYGDYLLAIWHPTMIKGLSAETLSTRSREWVRLEILQRSQKGDEGLVEFNAYYRGKQQQIECMHERSLFQRLGGRWFYLGGEIYSNDATERK